MLHILTAAGGNPTAIWVLPGPLSRAQYATRGADLMAAGAALVRLHVGEEGPQPEQAGFLLLPSYHLEMTGGELCGNATLSAAAMLSAHHSQSAFEMTTSDAPNRRPVSVTTQRDGDGMVVRCTLRDLPLNRETRSVGGQPVSVVDMGGIVHVLIEGAFPVAYRPAHRAVCAALGLDERVAVGVSWFERVGDAVAIEPVVRVRTEASETFVHESACGSGSIALAAASGCSRILQPTGECIGVEIVGGTTVLSARVVSVLTAAISG